jgi:hypothetical protein
VAAEIGLIERTTLQLEPSTHCSFFLPFHPIHLLMLARTLCGNQVTKTTMTTKIIVKCRTPIITKAAFASMAVLIQGRHQVTVQPGTRFISAPLYAIVIHLEPMVIVVNVQRAIFLGIIFLLHHLATKLVVDPTHST